MWRPTSQVGSHGRGIRVSSIISKINGEFLRELAKQSGAQNNSGGTSNISGLGLGASFDRDRINLTPGLNTAAQAFTNSYLRINDAITAVEFTKEALEGLMDLTKDLLSIARKASTGAVQDSDRLRLNVLYQVKVREFRKVLATAKKAGVDLLDQDDVRDLLSSAGIDPDAATQLAQIFKKLAGSDKILGYEKFRIDDVVVNTLQNKTVGAGTFSANFTRTGGDGTFIPVMTISPWWMKVGDGTFDPIFTSNTVGDGTFKAPASVLIEEDPEWSFIPVTNGSTSLGDGTFKAPVTLDTGAIQALQPILADFNNDGVLDLFTGSYFGGNYAQISLGNVDGTFKATSYYTASAYVSASSVVGDFNGDGKLDLLVNSGAELLLGNGDGSFKAYSSTGVTTTITATPSVGDLNGDGFLDIVEVQGYGQSSVKVYLGNGNGTFKAAVSFFSNSSQASDLADLNGDGVLDIVTANHSLGGGVNVLLGNGDGSFKAGVSLGYANATTIFARDVNGDGVNDLISNAGNPLNVAIGNGDGTFRAAISYEMQDPSDANWQLSLVDVNGDGQLDAIKVSQYNNYIKVAYGNADGSFTSASTYSALSSSQPVGVGFGDIDGDGSIDLLVGDLASGNISILHGNGTAIAATSGYGTWQTPVDVQLFDANQDGNLDLVSADKNTNTVSIQLGNGDGSFKSKVSYATGLSPDSVSFADVNGDGKLDLAVSNRGGDNVAILIGNGDGSFKVQTQTINVYTPGGALNHTFNPSVTGYDTGIEPVSARLADINRDGKLDLITANRSDGTISIEIGNGDGSFKAMTSFSVGVSPSAVSIGNINNDGSLDIVVADENGGTVSVLLGNGDGTWKVQANVYATGAGPTDLRLVDVNRDGKSDLITTDRDGNSISVQFGNGDGSFAARISYAVGSSPSGIDFRDINRDGNLDIVTSDKGSNTVSVLLGNSNGSFSAALSFVTGSSPSDIRIADMNRDGKWDIVTADEGSDTISILFGNGNGTFKARLSTATGDGPQNLVVADFNQDGLLDVATTNKFDDTISVLYGNSNGTFQGRADFAAGDMPRGIAAGDLNQDGFIDLVGTASGDNKANVFLANGVHLANGNFKTPAQYAVGDGPRSVSAHDLNGDGILDLVALDVLGNGGNILIGNGDGTYLARTSFVTTSGAKDTISFGDINNDGKIDILYSASSGNGVEFILGNGDGTFKTPISVGIGGGSAFSSLADFNNDGKLDVIYGRTATNEIRVALGNGDGTFLADKALSTGIQAASAVVIRDFNQDGILDFAPLVGTLSEFRVFNGNGDGTFKVGQTLTISGNALAIDSADVNGDGISDIIVGNETNGKVDIFIGNSNGTFKRSVSIGIPGAGDITSLKMKDINGDGKQDILVSYFTGGNGSIGVMLGNGDGTFKLRTTYALPSAPLDGPDGFVVADLNNDGAMDVAAAGYTQDWINVLLANRDNPTYAPSSSYQYDIPQYYATGDQPGSVQLKDVNQDGKIDLITSDKGSNTVSVQFGNGDGSFKARLSYATGITPTSVSFADVNRDGKIDLITSDSGSNTVSVLFGNSNGSFSAAVSYAVGSNPSDVTLADMNRDGILDIVSTDTNSNTVSILLGNSDGTFKARTSLSVGAGPIEAILEDFNQDGTIDIATINRSDRSMSVLYANSDGTFKAVQSYAAGNLASGIAAGDVDKDGRIDIIGSIAGENEAEIWFGMGDRRPQGTFKSGVSYAVTGNGYNSQLIDVDQDGNLDLFTGDNGFSLALGNGDGTFKAAISLGSLSGGYGGGYLSDINNDGKVDLLQNDLVTGRVAISLGNGDGTFKSALSFASTPQSSYGYAISIEDINADGKADLLAAGSNGFVTLLGNGDGTFKAPSTTGVDGYAKFGDFNHDGKLDVAVASDATDKLHIYFGNGDGTFKAGVSYNTVHSTGTTLSFSLGDLNHDGVLDAVVWTSGVGQEVLLGNSNGSFKAAVAGSNLGGSQELVDVNGDGNLDLVIGASHVALGNGNGSFLAPVSISGFGFSSIAVGDLNHDGAVDIVGTGLNLAHVFLGERLTANDSSGIPTLSNPKDITYGDFNRDGYLDFAVSNNNLSESDLSVYLGNGDGSFLAKQDYKFHTDVYGVSSSAQDLNGDGIIDIALMMDSGGGLGILLGNGDGTFKLGGSYDGGSSYSGKINFADLNGDGILDAYVNQTGGTGVRVWQGNGDGTFKASTVPIVGTNSTSAIAKDINGDGLLDLAVTDSTLNSTTIYIGNGDLTFKVGVSLTGITDASSVLAEDLDGNGAVDLIAYGTGGSPVVYSGNGDGTFKAGVSLAAPPAAHSFALEDINGDGLKDLVAFGSNASDRAAVYISNGDSTFLAPVSYSAGGGGGGFAQDINGDGIKDLVSVDYDGNQVNILLGNSHTIISGQQISVQSSIGGTHGIHVTDVNNDGVGDIINWGLASLGIQIANGDGTFKQGSTYLLGVLPSQIAFGDLNGDGISDFVSANNNSFDARVFLSDGSGGYTAGDIFSYLEPARGAAIADFTGDGTNDLLVSNRHGSEHLLYQGNGDGTFKSPVTVVGNTGALLQSADFNGDGIADYTATMFGLNYTRVFLSNGDGTFKIAQTIQTEAVLSLGDVNGDGQIDTLTLHNNYALLSLGNGDGTFKAPNQIAMPIGNLSGGGLQDVNNDGFLDIVGSSGGSLGVRLGNGNGSFKALTTQYSGSTPHPFLSGEIFGFGDVTGDGFADIVTSSYGTDRIQVLQGNPYARELRGDGSFSPIVSYGSVATLGFQLDGVRAVDLNGDGIPDLVSNDISSSTYRISMGNADGSFKSAVSYDAQDYVREIQFADVNNDGHIDLVATSIIAGSPVRITLGNGDGSFKATTSAGVGGTNMYPKLADFNNDGNLDLLVLTGDLASGAILFGNGDGSFSSPSTISPGGGKYAVADLNNDGTQDIVIETNSGMQALFGNGDGTFSSLALPMSIAPITVSEIRLRDLNNDGNEDIIALDSGGIAYVSINNGDGTFQASKSVYLGGSGNFELGDMTGDGEIDLVYRDNSTSISYVKIFAGNGDGSFSRPYTARQIGSSSMGTYTDNIEIVDLNGDGALDIIGSDRANATLNILFGNAKHPAQGTPLLYAPGDGTYNATKSYSMGVTNSTELRAVDLNEDGILDLVDAYGYISLGNANGTFKSSYNALNIHGYEPEFADLNGDGHLDVAFGNIGNGVSVAFGNGDGTFSVPTTIISSGETRAVQLADLNGDGKIDLISTDQYTQKAYVALGNGDGTFKAANTYNAGVSYDLKVGDFNNDGILDLATGSLAGNTAVSVVLGNGDGTFKNVTGWSATASAEFMALGDVNGDGKLDVVGGSHIDGDIGVWIGQGDGTGSAASIFSAGFPVYSINLSDVNQDGKLDIVAGTNSGIMVLEGNGDGTFKARVSYPLNASGTAVVADFNRDGALDLAGLNVTTGQLTVALGNQQIHGNTDFYRPVVTPAGAQTVTDVAIHDLNSDGYADVVAFNKTSGRFSVSLANSDGGLHAPVGYALGSNIQGASFADVNGDSIIDIIGGTNLGVGRVALGNGDGTFSYGVSFGAAGTDFITAVADFNGDGKTDIVTSTVSGAGGLGVTFGNGDGTFKATFTLSASTGGRVTIADINGDGESDIIVASTNGGDGYTNVYIGNGNGTFKAAASYANSGTSVDVSARDLNGDGYADVIVATSAGTDVRLGSASGTLQSAVSFTTPNIDLNDRLVVADITGDGQADIIRGGSGSTYNVWTGNSDGTFKAAVSYATLFDPAQFGIAAGDINGDAIQDLFIAETGTANRGYVLLGNGTVSTTGGFDIGADPTGMVVADFNGDGKKDFAVASISPNDNVQVFLGNGDGTYKAKLTFAPQSSIGSSPTSLTAGDFNGDGKVDIILNTSTNGKIEVMFGNGDGTFKAGSVSYEAGISYNITAKDVTNDGVLDLIAAQSGSSEVRVLVGNADGTFKAATTIVTSSAGYNAWYSDFNNDGKLDIVAAVNGSDTLEVAFGNGDGSFKAVTSYQVADGPRDIAVGDVNGDTIEDLVAVTFNGSNPVANVLLGNSDGTFKAATSFALRKSGLEVQLLDIDGDGKLDIVAATKTPGNTSVAYIETLLGNGDGTFKTSTTYLSGPRSENPTIGLSVEDLTGDGVGDIFAISSNPHVLPFEGSTKVISTGVLDIGVGQPGKGDPLKTKVTSVGNATLSIATLKELQGFIEKDLKGITKVLNQLKSAKTFAKAGANAFQAAADNGFANSPDALAEQILESIRKQARDVALGAHSKLDRKLVSELLKKD